jgi:hypothetical protein
MNKRLVFFISCFVCVAALSIGLGVGLSGNEDDVRDETPWLNFRLPDRDR